ncbi:hypothetical protein JTE90_018363 [Oedothorax gibbosus]|uniref:FLYWCH-type domain-containing protein n=1 Tax=Oedothorax gibbosus TaxID=931172 RepID=A0AAV6TK36_9ARAC|nr:hypothetical protein JTE90_018363 [Oedothorax gibbosus]
MDVECLNSKRGKPQFAINGYVYEKDKSKLTGDSKEIIYARCTQQRKDGCREIGPIKCSAFYQEPLCKRYAFPFTYAELYCRPEDQKRNERASLEPT